jgi:heat shock protein HtpX
MTTRLRTWLLISGLSALLVGFGALVGGTAGLLLFAGIAAVFNLVMYWFSDRLALRSSKAQPFPEDQAPELHAMVRDLAQRASVPVPRLFLIPSEQPNAFATGRNPEHAAVAVTAGLLQHMPPEQVKGVLAHEFAHNKTRDVLAQTSGGMIGAAIAAIANILQFSFLFGGGGDDDDSPVGIVGVIAAMIIAPIAATLLQLAVSRQREYLADATAAEFLGEGRPLAQALGTLERGVQEIPMAVNPATEALYIANPLHKGGVSALFSSHPPIPERIEKLRQRDLRAGLVW